MVEEQGFREEEAQRRRRGREVERQRDRETERQRDREGWDLHGKHCVPPPSPRLPSTTPNTVTYQSPIQYGHFAIVADPTQGAVALEIRPAATTIATLWGGGGEGENSLY